MAESPQKSAIITDQEGLDEGITESEVSSPRNMEQEQIADLQLTDGHITKQQPRSEQDDRTDNPVLIAGDSYNRISLRNNAELLNDRIVPALAMSTLQMQPEGGNVFIQVNRFQFKLNRRHLPPAGKKSLPNFGSILELFQHALG